MTTRVIISRQLLRADEKRDPLTWVLVFLDGERSASVVCANGHASPIGAHTVANDGKVEPSLDCPYDCDWHEWATLDGWNLLESN